MLDWQLWRYDPFGYRLTNLVLHAAASAAVAAALLLLIGDRGVALAGGALFAVHPIHVESVAWIAGRTDLLAGVLAVVSLLAWAAARPELLPLGRGASEAGPPGRRRVLLAASLAAYAAALAAKEAAVVVPAWLAVIHLVRRPPRLRAALLDLAPFAVVTLTYVALRFLVLGIPPPGQPEEHTLGLALLSAGPTLLRYLGWLAAPVEVQPFVVNPYVAGVLDPRFLLASAVTVVLVLVVRRVRLGAAPAALAAMTVVGFLPVLNLVRVAAPLDMGNPMAERFCYLPSFPFCGLVALGAVALWDRLRRPVLRPALAVAAAVVLVAGIGASRARCELWSDHLGLVRALHESAPDATLPAILLAEALAERGNIPEAGELLDRAERRAAREPSVIAARATWLVLQERWQEALGVQRRLVAALPHSNGLPESNLAFLLLRTGGLGEAQRLLEETVRERPGIAEAWYNLGDLRRRQTRWDDARAALARAAALAPAEPRFAAALADLELASGRPQEAAAVYERLLAVRGPEAPVLNNLAAVLARGGRGEAAIEALERALELDPGSVRARLNLAQLLAAEGRLEDARVELERVLAGADPDSAEARLARNRLTGFPSPGPVEVLKP